jgi:hypothetical protein
MKLSTIILSACALGASTFFVSAQDEKKEPAPPPPPGRPMSPIVAALDANKDGVIDATEIANAVAALKTLDKNGDGKLTQDEIRPPRGERGPGRGPGGGGGRQGGGGAGAAGGTGAAKQ